MHWEFAGCWLWPWGFSDRFPRCLDQNIPHVLQQMLKRVALGLGSPELSWTPAHPAQCHGSGCGEVLGNRLGSPRFGERPAAPSGLMGGQGGSSPLTHRAPCGGCDRLQGKSWSHLGTIRPHESRDPGSPWSLRDPARSLLSHQAPLRWEDNGGHCVRRGGLPRAGGTSLPPTAIRGTPRAPPDQRPRPPPEAA